jgi:hypothetical protein
MAKKIQRWENADAAGGLESPAANEGAWLRVPLPAPTAGHRPVRRKVPDIRVLLVSGLDDRQIQSSVMPAVAVARVAPENLSKSFVLTDPERLELKPTSTEKSTSK